MQYWKEKKNGFSLRQVVRETFLSSAKRAAVLKKILRKNTETEKISNFVKK